MEVFFEIVSVYYAFVFVVVGTLGSLVLNLDGMVYDVDYLLFRKRDFVRCVFMYQVIIWELLKDEINILGIAILEILTTFSVWFLNIIIFLILCVLLIIKWLCHLFWLIFRKINEE